MDGDKFRVLVNSDQYLCPTKSDEVSLTVFEKLPVANAVILLLYVMTTLLEMIKMVLFLRLI